ncbi:TetR/AcrR family transcriptional regulator [Rhodococcus sp. BGS-1C]|uniref:TetR/AcrR family transcriptional regulator n=1 Tax=unclassified Rhodococcus (in: high G+C Gram-positive bacteria) TaxID=192944 RepID=UPI00096022C6|nr:MULTISPECIES: TetR/AcrR family transcriptional regulator [unclassified Rhodococcus (in: high G+C Gram-positive bacteria)]MCC8930267.1 TetR/AcrR family transcriptional regulator [Rhodococcus sp. I2R]OLT32460.1 hypothetical protein BJF84_25215 [Rhodococcus sp. CUA-806]
MARATTGMYNGVTAGQRRNERRKKLMDAALEILGTRGWSAMTVATVCEEAKVGPRFLYESFENLDALALAVLDDIVATASANTVTNLAAAPDDTTAKVHAAVSTMVHEFADDPRRARIIFVESYGNAAMMKRRSHALHDVAALMATLATTFVDLPKGADDFIESGTLFLTGGVAELVIAWVAGDLTLSREELIDTCTEMMMTIGENAHAIAERLAIARQHRL